MPDEGGEVHVHVEPVFQALHHAQGGVGPDPAVLVEEEHPYHITLGLNAVLPDGYSQILRSYCVWPFGLLDYGSATPRSKI